MNQLEPSWAKGYPGGLAGVGWPQLATYPQSPFSGPACCCDVAYLSQAFSQPTGPGRLWISLGAVVLLVPIRSNESVIAKRKPTHTQKS